VEIKSQHSSLALKSGRRGVSLHRKRRTEGKMVEEEVNKRIDHNNTLIIDSSFNTLLETNSTAILTTIPRLVL
jgi:hypothetical protein